MHTQHFHSARGCLSYITHNTQSKEATLIDPSAEVGVDVYVKYLRTNYLTLLYVVETHTHADHISIAREMSKETGAQIVRHQRAPSPKKDIAVSGGEELLLGEEVLHVLSTPGHTNESISLYNGIEVFTGDALLIGGTGRTDFQVGDSEELYQSLHHTLKSLPPETLVRPGHYYCGRNQAILGDEIRANPRMMLCKSEFMQFMDAYHPKKPELFEHAINENSQ
jgi:sulfur dioxygenase